jgi:hypothetical protein
MIFTTIVCIEVVLFVLWFIYKIISIMCKHKVVTSIIIIGAIYLLISGHPSNVVNTNSQKSSIPANAANGNGIKASDSSDYGLSAGSQSVLYPGENCYETGADGHRIALNNNRNAVDPTYHQLMNFLTLDDSDKIPYNYSNFESTDFAERVHDNAEAAGYKCAWVDINFVNNGATHACNAFNTVDQGLVFIDCTNSGNLDNDKIVDLKVGKGYRPEGIGDCRCVYYSMGVVRNYLVYW